MDDRGQQRDDAYVTLGVGEAPPLGVAPGEDVVLFLPAGACDGVVAATLGLVESPAIRVEVEGRSWASCDAWEAAALRGAMGWTFVRTAWLSNFSVLENITLQSRHHGHRPDREIVGEADAMAQRLDLPGVPRERPHLCEPEVLRRCEWIRALMNAPALLLLAYPERGAEAWAAALAELVAESCPDAARLWCYPASAREARYGPDGARQIDLSGVALPVGFDHLFK